MSDETGMNGFEPNDAFGLLRSYSRHIRYVQLGLSLVTQALEKRGLVHDASKLLDDEFAGFSRINATARTAKFGSEEYREGMQRERATIDLHFSRNSHHPEYPELVAGKDTEPDDYKYAVALDAAALTFLDIIEMVCDWWGARKGYGDARPWKESVTINLQIKGKYLTPDQLWLAQQVAEFLEKQEETK